MGSQAGGLPQYKIGKVFPSSIKLPAEAALLYVATFGGFSIPVTPMVSLGRQANAALATNAFLTLFSGAASNQTIINKVVVRTSVAGKYELRSNAVITVEFFLETNKYQEIDFGPYGTTEFCQSAGQDLRLYNQTGGAVDIAATAFGNQLPNQT